MGWKREKYAIRRERIRKALEANQDIPTKDLAERFGVHRCMIRTMRKEIKKAGNRK